MNGFADHGDGLHDHDFDEPKGLSVRTFDAFPKTKPHYLTRTSTGGAWTIALFLASALLIIVETRHWFAGTTNHAYMVEKGVSHQLQINVDIVVKMQCGDLNVNVQDASGDRILAGEQLKRDPTNWSRWGKAAHHKLQATVDEHMYEQGEDEDVHDYLGLARKGKRKFSKTPRVQGAADSCRIYGSLEGNKVQGDFHITARGHGYLEFGMHLDHSQFNFSHHVNELSFGPYYPSLINPLDNTFAETAQNFYKFQYYCNIVPTIYTTDIYHLHLNPHQPRAEPLNNLDPAAMGSHGSTVWTNQYAVTEQSHPVPETNVPGVFFKYDIEPLLLVINEQRGGLLALLVRLVNVVSGVLVAGTWLLQFTDWAVERYVQRFAGGQAWMGLGAGGAGRERLGFLGRKDERFV